MTHCSSAGDCDVDFVSLSLSLSLLLGVLAILDVILVVEVESSTASATRCRYFDVFVLMRSCICGSLCIFMFDVLLTCVCSFSSS